MCSQQGRAPLHAAPKLGPLVRESAPELQEGTTVKMQGLSCKYREASLPVAIHNGPTFPHCPPLFQSVANS